MPIFGNWYARVCLFVHIYKFEYTYYKDFVGFLSSGAFEQALSVLKPTIKNSVTTFVLWILNRSVALHILMFNINFKDGRRKSNCQTVFVMFTDDLFCIDL